MVLFPYKKLVIETEMSEEAFFSKLNEITDERVLFGWGFSDNYFLGDISQNAFNLMIAYENYKPKEYKSLHNTKIKGIFDSNLISLKIGYGLSNYYFLIYFVLFSFLFVDEFALNFKSIFFVGLAFILTYQNFREYSYFKMNCKEIERKFLELSNGKLCKE